MICQDMEALESVYQYDFDAQDLKFQMYFLMRTGLAVDDTDLKLLSMSLEDAKHWLHNTPDFLTIINEMIPFEDRPLFWKSYRIKFGQLQDCWELFQKYHA